jgi:hypothetical protein
MPIHTVRFGPLLAATLVLGLAACSTQETATAAASPSAQTSTAASPSPAPSSFGPRMQAKKLAPYSTAPAIAQPVIGKAVTKRFGQARAASAYEHVVDFLRTESLDMDRLRPKSKYTKSDFASVSTHMLPPTREYWRDHVGRALKGSKVDIGDVRLLSYWNMGDHGFVFPKTGPYVVDETIGQSVLYIDEASKWLAVSATYSASVRMTRAGQNYRRPFSKQITLVVFPFGDSWLLGEYKGHWTLGDALPE